MKINNFYITKSTYSRHFYIEIFLKDSEDKYATVYLELGKTMNDENFEFTISRLNSEHIVTVINKKTLTYVT